MTTLSRRQLFKRTAIYATALVAALGLGAAATYQPEYQESANYGATNPMNKKILVAYATRAGSTLEIAQALAKTLAAQGAAVDVLPVKNVADLKNYQSVVLGSAVRMGQWLPEALKFVEQNQAALNQMPMACFTVHLMNIGSDEASRKARLVYLDGVRKLAVPKKEAYFAGVGDWKKVSFIDGLIAKAVKAPEGDFRDWQAVGAWAEELRQSGFAGSQA